MTLETKPLLEWGTDTDIFITGVVDDIQVDVIKSTDADEFTFSATVFDFSLCGQGVFKFNLTIFLCRYGEEYNLSVQLFFTSSLVRAKAAPMTPASWA